jgi:integrase
MGVIVRQKTKGKGNPWWVFISHNGKRTSRKVGDKGAAEEVGSMVRAKLQLGEFSFEDPKKAPTFKEHADLWFSLPHGWKESTRENYIFNLEKHILPVLGSMEIGQIRRRDIKLFCDKMLAAGKSVSTVKLALAPISGVLSHALDSELIDNNPAAGLKFGKKPATDIKALSREEAARLLSAAQEHDGGSYHAPILLALRTGMRIGEIMGLKWKDLNFKTRMIEVKRSCRHGRTTRPKNGKSRKVDMTPMLAETLKDLQIDQKKNALQAGRPFSKWVFKNALGGQMRYQMFRNTLLRCLKKAGIRRIRVHDLRHTYATIRLLSGHNIGDISYQLGHSSIKITYDTYGHWVPGKFKSEVDDLDFLHLNAPQAHPAKDGSNDA